MSRPVALAVLASLVAGCEAGSPAGHDAAPPPVEIVLPAVTVTARSQLWAPAYSGLAPGALHLYWLDAADACEDPEGLVQRAGVPWLDVTVVSPAVGVDCPVIDREAWDAPDGCYALVEADLADERGWIFSSPANAGAVRITRAEGGRLTGTVRAAFTPGLFAGGDCGWSSGGGGVVDGVCNCVEPGGTRTCTFTTEADWMCCDDGDPVEVEIPFAADSCGAAAECWWGPCPALAIDPACEPSPALPRDCVDACDGFLRVCRACSGCAPEDEECNAVSGCDGSACLEACTGVLAHDPTVATSLRCFAASGGCDSWLSCMRGCGDD